MPPAHPTLLLASASPARLATLRSAGVEPLVRVSSVDEDAVVAAAEEVAGAPLEAADVALLLARAKAEDVVTALEIDTPRAARTPRRTTASSCSGATRCSSSTARCTASRPTPPRPSERWGRMRGRTGVLHTGHWLVDLRDTDSGGTGGMVGGTASTTVHFADLDDAEVEAYVATGEPLTVAGAFTLDGLGGPYVSGIEGDPSNVIGVSLPLLRELLRELGVAWHDLRTDRQGRVESETRRGPAGPAACCLLSTAQTGGTSRRLSANCRSRWAA